LANGLRRIPTRYIESHYQSVIEKIDVLDADSEFGLKGKIIQSIQYEKQLNVLLSKAYSRTMSDRDYTQVIAMLEKADKETPYPEPLKSKLQQRIRNYRHNQGQIENEIAANAAWKGERKVEWHTNIADARADAAKRSLPIVMIYHDDNSNSSALRLRQIAIFKSDNFVNLAADKYVLFYCDTTEQKHSDAAKYIRSKGNMFFLANSAGHPFDAWVSGYFSADQMVDLCDRRCKAKMPDASLLSDLADDSKEQQIDRRQRYLGQVPYPYWKHVRGVLDQLVELEPIQRLKLESYDLIRTGNEQYRIPDIPAALETFKVSLRRLEAFESESGADESSKVLRAEITRSIEYLEK
ncbi:MAG: hypothetical protein AAFP90_23820, partial [Planctomycetota bacterium]